MVVIAVCSLIYQWDKKIMKEKKRRGKAELLKASGERKEKSLGHELKRIPV
jgi:hypothetical protein